MLSVSTESLDQIVTREKYLQATFESMSGAEMESTAIGNIFFIQNSTNLIVCNSTLLLVMSFF